MRRLVKNNQLTTTIVKIGRELSIKAAKAIHLRRQDLKNQRKYLISLSTLPEPVDSVQPVSHAAPAQSEPSLYFQILLEYS